MQPLSNEIKEGIKMLGNRGKGIKKELTVPNKKLGTTTYVPWEVREELAPIYEARRKLALKAIEIKLEALRKLFAPSNINSAPIMEKQLILTPEEIQIIQDDMKNNPYPYGSNGQSFIRLDKDEFLSIQGTHQIYTRKADPAQLEDMYDISNLIKPQRTQEGESR